MDGLAGYDYVFYPGPTMNANKVKILQQGSAAGAFPELAAGTYPTAITSDTITFYGSLRNCSSRSRFPNLCSRKRANGYEQRACHEGSTNHVYRIFFSAAVKRLRHLRDSPQSLRRAGGNVAEPGRRGIFPRRRPAAPGAGVAIFRVRRHATS